MKSFVTMIFAMWVTGAGSTSFAETLPPDQLIQGSVKDVLELISQNGKSHETGQKKLLEFIDIDSIAIQAACEILLCQFN